MTGGPDYPFVPRSNAHLRPGQFFAVELEDGRYACGRVISNDRADGYGARTWFVGALHDWVSSDPPTVDSIAGAPLLEAFHCPFGLIPESGGPVLGLRPLAADGIALGAGEPRSYVSETYAMELGNRTYVRPPEEPTYELRDVGSPLTAEMLAPMSTPRGTIQASTLPDKSDRRVLAEWLERHPHVDFRVFDMELHDLEFLVDFPALKRVWVDGLSLTSLDGLRHSPDDVEMIRFGFSRRRLDLQALSRFTELRSLYLEKHTKNIEVISGFEQLEELTLRSVTVSDLSLLVPMQRLRALELKLGGTKDLRLLSSLGSLEYFEAWMVKGLTDLSSVAEVPTLRFLFLQALSKVERLPDLGGNSALVRAHLEGLKGLTSVDEVVSAPNLRDVVLLGLPNIAPEALAPFGAHPALERALVGLGSARKNKLAETFVGRPRARYEKDWRRV